MIRILQSVNIMDRAGLENMLMNYYRNIDRTQIQFDFLTHRPNEGAYDREIKQMGGIVYHAPRLYPQNYGAYLRYMKALFAEHPEYKIIHSHIDTMSAFPLFAAKLNRVPVRIAHSHSSRLDVDAKLPIKYLAKLALPHVANTYFSCGEKAGEFLYGSRPFTVVRNAINLKRFAFHEDVRREVRARLGLENSFVIGHVGRYCYIKNQKFLIEIFVNVLRYEPGAKLLLIGKGEDEAALRAAVSEKGLEEQVLFLVDRGDVEQLYQAMDVFVMPSLFEGVPMVGVEAQANGLPCLVSDRISPEILLTSNISVCSLDSSPEEWARRILQTDRVRSDTAAVELTQAGYDITTAASNLMELYQNIYEKIE